MNSVIFQETAKLKKPVPAEKIIELSEKLLEPSIHSKKYPPRLHKTWGTIVFMVAIHILSLIAIQPRILESPCNRIIIIFLLGYCLSGRNSWISQIVIAQIFYSSKMARKIFCYLRSHKLPTWTNRLGWFT